MRPEEKIYRAYRESGKQVLYFNEIKELTGLSDSSLTNALRRLVKSEALGREQTKSNTFYSLKDKKLAALRFSELAAQAFDRLNPGVKTPLRHFLKDIPPEAYTIVLFGSAARREERRESDIDLLVVGRKGMDLAKSRKEAQVTSRHRISVFQATVRQFLENEDEVVVQARKTGFPIHKEQNFYEAILDGHR